MAPVITVIGVGPGSVEYLTPAALEAAGGAELLVGGRRALELLARPGQETLLIDGNLEKSLEDLAARWQKVRVAVLTSGDPGFYSLLPLLKERFGAENLVVIPGVSSLQLAFARLKEPWQGVRTVSLHGRDLKMLDGLAMEFPVAFLTGPACPPARLAARLLELGWPDRPAWILEDLGLNSERREEMTLSQLARNGWSGGNCLVVMLHA